MDVKLLLERASAVKLQEPGLTQEELDTILRGALRAPDHGRLRPWHFIVISGEARARFGMLLAESLKARVPDATREMLDREQQKALRAPRDPRRGGAQAAEKIPEVEQIVSAGAAAEHIMLAAQASAMARCGAPASPPMMRT